PNWQPVTTDLSTLKASDFQDTNRWRQDAMIQAQAIAASVAASFASQNTLALSGAGAVSTNTVLSKTNAYVGQSTVSSATSLKLDARGTASIDATVVAASAALGFSTQSAAGASLGIGYASNLVGWKQDGTEDQAQVRSLVTNSSITTTGDLTLDA